MFVGGLPRTIRTIEINGNFRNTKRLTGDVVLPYLQSKVTASCFEGSGLERVLDLGDITLIDGSAFNDCASLWLAILPSTYNLSKWNAFRNTSLSVLICKATTPPTLNEGNNFTGTPLENGTGTIYVPDGSVEAYKTATNWSRMANVIRPLSDFPTDNPSLYAELEQYL